MNRHFQLEGGESPEIPPSMYARIDSIEPESQEAMRVGFDAVSTRSADAALNALRETRWRDAWEAVLAGREPVMGFTEALERLEIFHIEASFRSIRFCSKGRLPFPASGNAWLKLDTSGRDGGRPASFYSTLFSPPTSGKLGKVEQVQGQESRALAAAFSMEGWPTVSPDTLTQYFNQVNADVWAAFDVGQGSANGLLGDRGPVSLWHDLGCGVYRNAATTPNGLILCHSQTTAPVVLSHWDTDHWAGSLRFAPPSDPHALLRRPWIAPRDDSVGPRHIAFANQILAAKGMLFLLPEGGWRREHFQITSGRSIALIKGSGKARNEAGVALEVRDHEAGRCWLLTGDVEYRFLSGLEPRYVAMSVPHHGATPKRWSYIPKPHYQNGYARLVYSFGESNSYHHPTHVCQKNHATAGWVHGTGLPHPLKPCKSQRDVLATVAGHSGVRPRAALVGWTSPPAPLLQPPCGHKCNAAMVQS